MQAEQQQAQQSGEICSKSAANNTHQAHNHSKALVTLHNREKQEKKLNSAV
jgi:hypothetical protein